MWKVFSFMNTSVEYGSITYMPVLTSARMTPGPVFGMSTESNHIQYKLEKVLQICLMYFVV